MRDAWKRGLNNKIFIIVLLAVFIMGDKVQAATVLGSGTSGDLEWSVDADGCFHLSGSGDYKIYGSGLTYWYEYLDEIKSADINVKNITSLEKLFQGCKNLEDISWNGIDTSNVTDMSCMFNRCENLQSIDLSSFDTSNVTSMWYMFAGCESLVALELNNFNTSNVTDMNSMFMDCYNLETINLNNFNTSKVTDMHSMFEMGTLSLYSSKLTNLDLSNFDTSQVTDMGRMFFGCKKLTDLNISSFNTEQVTDMNYMFAWCSNLKLEINHLNTSNVTDMSGFFAGCRLDNIDLGHLNTNNVTDMSGMFRECDLTGIDFKSLDTSNVTHMGWMFLKCKGESLDLSNFDTSHVTIIDEMFQECSNLKSLDISSFDLSSLESAEDVLWESCSLDSIKVPLKLNLNIELPEQSSIDWEWENEKGEISNCLPKNLSTSFWLYRDGTGIGDEDETNPIPEKPSGVSAFDQNIVNNIDVSKYTQGINLGKDTIHGPLLNIMGKEIELFSIDANVKLEIADEVTYKINAKDKTIEVLVGVESRDGKVDFSDDANSDSEWTKTYSQVKSLYQGITKEKSTKNLYNQFRSLRNKLHSTNSTLLISGDVKSVLFLKFSYETGKIELMEGGGIVSAELGADWEKRIPQVPLAYVTVGAKASGELTFKVVPAWSGELGIDLALNAGVGIGEKKHAKTYIEGGTKVTLKNKLKLPAKSIAESLSIKVNGKGYLKAKVFGMVVGEISKDYVNMNLYPEFGMEKNALFLSPTNLGKKLSPESVEYVTSAATVENEREVDFEKKDLYPYCAPILTDLGNNCYLLVWVDDIGDKDTYNRTTLMYSYYNGGQWTSPQKVAESEYLNDYPAVYGKDGVAYVVWQQTTQKCDENTTVEEMLTYSDLYGVKFENESFGTPFAITNNNEVYEMQQQVCITGDKVYVAWIENSEDDPFMGKNETNTIYMKEITNDSSEKIVVSDNLETVSNVVIGEVDNRFVVAYEDGTNGYLYDGDSIQSLSNDGDKLMNLEIKDGLLYALVNDYVSEYKNGSFASLGLPLAGDYTVLSDGARIVSNVSDGDTSKLVMYTKYNNEWNDGVALTDGTKYVRNYQMIEKENGEPIGAVCEVEINLETEDIYGKADLYVDNLEAKSDLELLDTVYTDRENPIAGENLTLYYEVANKGVNQVDEFTISLADQDGTVLQEEPVNIQIQSGTTAKESITVTMPDNMEKQDYILSIQSGNDQVEGNNQIAVTLGYSDVSIKECNIDECGTITGLLLNEGYETAENVRVKVYKDSMDTEPVKELSYDSMTAGQQQELLVSLSQEDLVAINGALGTTWILDVETDSVEAGYGNNTDTVFCYRSLELSLTDSIAVPVGKTAQLKMTDNLTRDNFSDKVLWSSSDEDVVFVSDTGVIKGVKMGTAEVYAWFEDEMYTCHVIVNDTSKSEGIKQEESKTETAQPEKTKPSQKQTLPVVGIQIASSSAIYKVTKSTSSQKEVTYVKPKSKNKTSVSIPDTIKINGFTYKVTSVSSNALLGNKKVTKVTAGKNVTSIGKSAFKKCTKLKTVTLKSTSLKSIGSNAFYGDKNLKAITIKSSKLTSKSVGKNAFKGTNKKLTIKVPKKKVSSYKKFLKKKGNKKVTVKK